MTAATRVRANQAMRLILRRFNGHGRDINQDDRGGPTWVGTCPNHDGRAGMVRFDQHTNGTVSVHPHRDNGEIVCEPSAILAAVAIADDRIRLFTANNGHGDIGTSADPFARPARTQSTGPAEDSHEIFERLNQALVDAGCAGTRSHTGRYRCPACGSPGDGHGLRITHNPNAAGTKRKVLLICDTNRCETEEILERLGMTLAEICAGDDVDDLGGGDEVEAEPVDRSQSSALTFATLAELCARVDAAGPRRYLIRGIWPAGAYGVHAAEMKAQKTWNALDAVVSVASGTAWLGAFPVDDPGPVVIFAGEGGEASTVRRLRAVCTGRGLTAERLPITVCTRAPHLGDLTHMAAFAEHVGTVRPRLVLLDPLYLSLGGADGKDLYGMGRLLERPQILCDQLGASLLVVTHFNRGGRTGAGRITGAGPAEWGRVLIGAEIKSRHTDTETKATTVIAELDVMGGEIPDLTFRIKRTISADDPDNLDSPMHYAVAVMAADSEAARDDMPPARRKLLDAVTALAAPSDQKDLVDWIAGKHGHGLTRQTVSRELNALREADLVDCTEQAGWPTLWFLPPEVSPVLPRQVDDTRRQGASGGVSPLSPHIGDSDTPTPQSDTSEVSPSIPGADLCETCSEPLDRHAGPGCLEPVIHRPDDLWSSA